MFTTSSTVADSREREHLTNEINFWQNKRTWNWLAWRRLLDQRATIQIMLRTDLEQGSDWTIQYCPCMRRMSGDTSCHAPALVGTWPRRSLLGGYKYEIWQCTYKTPLLLCRRRLSHTTPQNPGAASNTATWVLLYHISNFLLTMMQAWRHGKTITFHSYVNTKTGTCRFLVKVSLSEDPQLYN